METAEIIKRLRKEAGLTQEELAVKLGLQKSAIAKYENGRVDNIKKSTIKKMSEIFNCSPNMILGYEEPRHLGEPANVSVEDAQAVAELTNIYLHLSKEDKEYLLITARRLTN